MISPLKTFVAGFLIVGTVSAAYAAERIGFAKADDSFTIWRDEAPQVQKAERLSAVELNDRLTAGEQPVWIHAPSGAAVLIGSESTVRFTEQGEALLEEGSIAVAFSDSNPIPVLFEDLIIRGQGTGEKPVVLVRKVDSETVEVRAVEGSATVRQQETDRQIVYLATDDVLWIIREENRWRAVSPGVGAPSKGDVTTADSVTGSTGSAQKKRALAAAANSQSLIGGGGGGAAGGAGVAGATAAPTGAAVGGAGVATGGVVLGVRGGEDDQPPGPGGGDSNSPIAKSLKPF